MQSIDMKNYENCVNEFFMKHENYPTFIEFFARNSEYNIWEKKKKLCNNCLIKT